MIRVSVIIPVYNVEKYLEACLESLVNQTFKDFELIVINDGSTDNCQDIILNYKKKYPNLIRSYSFPNQGISKSRNFGIEVSRGEYLAFIDSDDYVDEDFLKDMYAQIRKTKSDICVCDYYTLRDDRREECLLENFSTSSVKNNPQLLLKINPSPWNKLFKKSLFRNLKFEEIKYEDLLLVTELLCKAKNIVKLNKCLNFYRVRQNSETVVVDERVFDILKILDQLNNYFKSQQLFDTAYDEIEYFNIYRIMIYVIQQRYQKDKSLKKKFIEEAFAFLNNNFPKWRQNKYYAKRQVLKKLIESHELLAKIYVNLD